MEVCFGSEPLPAGCEVDEDLFAVLPAVRLVTALDLACCLFSFVETFTFSSVFDAPSPELVLGETLSELDLFEFDLVEGTLRLLVDARLAFDLS